MSIVSRTDAWAVGDINLYPKPSAPIIEHWDGRRWRQVAIPGVRTPLNGVTALSTRDVWVVGGGGSAEEPAVTLHWNGVRWTRVASPSPRRTQLNDVVAISMRDVWAVGSLGDSLFTMHWDGLRWQPFVGPALGEQSSRLASAAAVTTNDVWAVGEARSGNTIVGPVVYHWNGTQWKTTRSPPIDGGLFGIAVQSAGQIWTVAWDDPVLGGDGATISRWNGTTWHSGKPLLRRFLAAVSTDRGTHLWAVGSTGNPIDENESTRPRPLVERYGC